MMYFGFLFGIVMLLITLMWMTRQRNEHFMDLPNLKDLPNPEDLPAPQEIFKNLRKLLDKYDTPGVWDHATQMIDKDPGQLARLQLGIANSGPK